MKNLSVSLLLFSSTVLNSQTTITISLCGTTFTDAGISNGQPAANYGNYPYFGAYAWTCNGTLCLSRGLMKIDFSSIPANATITSASFLLFADIAWGATPTTGSPNSGSLLKVTSSWTESAVNWATQPGTTGTGSVAIAQSTSSIQNYTLNMTSMVQGWVSAPASNFGFLIKLDDESIEYKALMFGSSDGDPSRCPKLIVGYTVPTATSGLADLKENDNIVLYPNPGAGIYTVSGLSESSPFSVMDVLGVQKLSGSASISIDLSSLPDGLYFIRFAESGRFCQKTLVKISER